MYWVMYQQMLHVSEIRQVDLHWMMYGMLSGPNAVVVSTLKAGAGKTASLPLLRRLVPYRRCVS
jgi:hypothetical protein